MGEKQKITISKHISISFPSTSDLRGKQSVRATFKLSQKSIDALSIVAMHLGIKQKSLFDHLLEDNKVLNSIAKDIEINNFNEIQRVQKTFVLSRKSLFLIEKISDTFNIPRDALVELSIQRLNTIIKTEQEKHKKRIEILNELAQHWKKSEEIYEKSCKILNEDDPVCLNIESAIEYCRQALRNIDIYVEKGKIIESF